MVCLLSLMGQHCVETVAPTMTSPRPSKTLLKRRVQLYRHPHISRVFMASAGSWWGDCTAVRLKAYSTTQVLLARGVGSTCCTAKSSLHLIVGTWRAGMGLGFIEHVDVADVPSTNMYTRALQLSMCRSQLASICTWLGSREL